MRSPYNALFWGFIFVIVDLNFGIDFLPDFIGFMLITNGLNMIKKYSVLLERALPFAYILVIYSLPQFIGLPENSLFDSAYPVIRGEWGWLFYDQVYVILLLILIYCICRGAAEMAREAGKHELQKQGNNTWNFYFIFNALLLISVPFTLNVPFVSNLIIMFFVLGIIAMIVLLVFLRRMHWEMTDVQTPDDYGTPPRDA